MEARKDAKKGKTPRTVLRGVNSHIVTEVGVHWLRISFPEKYLHKAVKVTGQFFEGEPENLDRGFWGYDRQFKWPSNVRLLYDVHDEKLKQHNHRCYFECQGKACDELSPDDLILLMQIFLDCFEGRGERIDVFLDDFARRIDPQGLHEIIKRKDHSRFRNFSIQQDFVGVELVYDAVIFGSRKKDWVKQLECYDKNLESKGEKNCIRWEAKFREDKAHKAFMMLAGTCGNLDAFAMLCGSIVVGCISFIHRTGDKNIDRLDEYAFWLLIKQGLGDLRIRTMKKRSTLPGVIEWTQRQVAPSLSLLKNVLGEKMFFSLIVDLVADGDSRMNANHRAIIEQCAGSFIYKSKTNPGELENRYVNAMCSIS